MAIVRVEYENPNTHELFEQQIQLTDEQADEVYSQMFRYDGSQIPLDSPVYYLLTAIRYISKLQGFDDTPNFNIIPPDDIEFFNTDFIGEN